MFHAEYFVLHIVCEVCHCTDVFKLREFYKRGISIQSEVCLFEIEIDGITVKGQHHERKQDRHRERAGVPQDLKKFLENPALLAL